jgi:hypothetical protein
MSAPIRFLFCAGLLLGAAAPAAAAAQHGFINRTTAGLRCRLATETNDRALTITLEAMEEAAVDATYKDIRCDEPVVRKRFPLAPGGRYVFHRNADGNTINLRPE